MQELFSIQTIKRYAWWIGGIIFSLFLFWSLKYDNALLILLPVFILLALLFIRSVRDLFFLLIVCLPLSTEYQFTASLGTDLPDEFLMIGLSGIFIAWAIANKNIFQPEFFRHSLFVIVLVYFGWICISTIFSSDIVLSIKFLLAKTWYIIPFVILPQYFMDSSKSYIRLASCLLIPVLLVVIISLLRHSAYNFSFDRINDTLAPFFRNHVNYGAMLVCSIPVCAGLFFSTGKRKYKLILFITVLILLTGLFFSYSRGAWLALLMGLLAFLAIRKQWMMRFLFMITVIISSLIIFLSVNNRYLNYAPNFRKTIYHADFAEHMKATYQFRDLSTAERFYRWVAGARMITEHPLLGFGPNTFVDHYKQYAVTTYQTYVSRNPEKSTVHNYFLLTSVEQGIPALLILLLLIGYMFYMAQRIYYNSGKREKIIAMITAVVLMMIVTLNMLSDLLETDKIGTLFFLCVGILLKLDSKKEQAA